MRKHRFIVLTFCSLLVALSAQAETWTTHFAYNNVTQIAMSPDEVFAISDGSLFSVNKQSEKITKYDRQSGLHGTGINCIHYDATGKQLIIAYANGKIDVLSANGVRYISDLYDKDMTQQKTIYNVTIQGRTAYLSTHYGVQTMDLRENKLVDSYWLRPGGQETPIQDVLLTFDSIFAFASDSLYSAALTDNLVDYTYWKREKRSARILPDATKGKRYVDGSNTWSAGGSVGITRVTPTETLHYKPEGPLVNKPYRLTATKDGVWVVPGGRWATQNNEPGVVMRYDGTNWFNISTQYIQSKTGMRARDFMNIAVDSKNKNHYYVTSFGTGLYEFDHDTLVRHVIAGEDNPITSAWPPTPELYTRLDFSTYDSQGNLWLTVASGEYPLVVFSHGAFGYYQSNMSTYTELASHGYIVVALDHPHHSFFTTDTSGAAVIVDTNFINDVMRINDIESEEEAFMLSHEWLKLRTDDENFVLDTIIDAAKSRSLNSAWNTDDADTISKVVAEIDIDKIGLFGHSLGGATAVTVGRKHRNKQRLFTKQRQDLGNISAHAAEADIDHTGIGVKIAERFQTGSADIDIGSADHTDSFLHMQLSPSERS